MIANLQRRWEHFFFAPDYAENLAICRILFYGGLLALHWHVDFAAWGYVADIFWMPTRLFEMLDLPRLGPEVLRWLSIVWKISLALSSLGLLTRLAGPVAFALGFYLLGLPHSLGNLAHGDAAAVLILGVMALARSGDALSLDRLLWGRRSSPTLPLSGEYRWPVRATWLILSTVFFAAGYAKFVKGGWAWALSENLAFILVENQFPPEYPFAMVSWGQWIARQPWIYQSMALGALLLELCYPLAMVNWRFRLVLAPGMVAALLGFRVLLGPSFLPLMLCHLFWVRWWPAPRWRQAVDVRKRLNQRAGSLYHRSPRERTKRAAPG